MIKIKILKKFNWSFLAIINIKNGEPCATYREENCAEDLKQVASIKIKEIVKKTKIKSCLLSNTCLKDENKKYTEIINKKEGINIVIKLIKLLLKLFTKKGFKGRNWICKKLKLIIKLIMNKINK